MANRKPRTVLFRRKREQKTDYQSRLKILLSKQLRVVVRFTNSRVIGQIIEFQNKGDKVLVGVDSTALKEMGWGYSQKNFPASYLTGLLLGKTAKSKGIKQAIFDAGSISPLKKSKVYAFLKGVIDGGLTVPHEQKEIFPTEDHLSGKHIATYAQGLKGKKEYEQRFGQYIKSNNAPEKVSDAFAQVKHKILGSKEK